MIEWVRVRMIYGRWEDKTIKRLYVGEKFIDMIVYEADVGWHSDSYPQIEVTKTAEEIARQILELEHYL